MIWQDPILNFMPEVIKCSFTLPFAYCARALGASNSSCVQAGGCAGDSIRHHSCGPRSSWSRSTQIFHVTQSPHPRGAVAPFGCWPMDRLFFCQVFIQCSVSPLLSLVYLIYFKWMPGCGDSPSLLHPCSAEPTHLPLLDSKKRILWWPLARPSHCLRQACGRLPPGHTEGSGSDLRDTRRLVSITDALALRTAKSHVAPVLAWGKIHKDLSLGWAELNNRSRNMPQRSDAKVFCLCGHQQYEQGPLLEVTGNAVTLYETGVRTLSVTIPAPRTVVCLKDVLKIHDFPFQI